MRKLLCFSLFICSFVLALTGSYKWLPLDVTNVEPYIRRLDGNPVYYTKKFYFATREPCTGEILMEVYEGNRENMPKRPGYFYIKEDVCPMGTTISTFRVSSDNKQILDESNIYELNLVVKRTYKGLSGNLGCTRAGINWAADHPNEPDIQLDGTKPIPPAEIGSWGHYVLIPGEEPNPFDEIIRVEGFSYVVRRDKSLERKKKRNESLQ